VSQRAQSAGRFRISSCQPYTSSSVAPRRRARARAPPPAPRLVSTMSSTRSSVPSRTLRTSSDTGWRRRRASRFSASSSASEMRVWSQRSFGPCTRLHVSRCDTPSRASGIPPGPRGRNTGTHQCLRRNRGSYSRQYFASQVRAWMGAWGLHSRLMAMSEHDPSGGLTQKRDWEAELIHDLGKWTRKVREFLNFSQDRLAKLAGVSQGAVSRVEAGRGKATPLLTFTKINQVFAKALSELDPSMLSDEVRAMLDRA